MLTSGHLYVLSSHQEKKEHIHMSTAICVTNNIIFSTHQRGPAVCRGTHIFMPRHEIRCLPWNLLFAAEKHGIARFLLHSYLIHGLSDSDSF